MMCKGRLKECDYSIQRVSYMQNEYCGDDGIVVVNEKYILACLFDGLGHGENAYFASHKAAEYVKSHQEYSILELVYGLHDYMRNTRGCVGGFCRIDLISGEMEYIGVGNISTRIIGHESIHIVSYDGVLGYGDIHPRIRQNKLHPGEIIIMYSDGLKDFSIGEEYQEILYKEPCEISEYLVKKYGKSTDDKSCLIIKY